MTIEQFTETTKEATPPAGLAEPLKAMWYAGKGDWKRAHEVIQDIETKTAYQIHAFLHRQEGDIKNAGYWYHRAGKGIPEKTLAQEWKDITKALL